MSMNDAPSSVPSKTMSDEQSTSPPSDADNSGALNPNLTERHTIITRSCGKSWPSSSRLSSTTGCCASSASPLKRPRTRWISSGKGSKIETIDVDYSSSDTSNNENDDSDCDWEIPGKASTSRKKSKETLKSLSPPTKRRHSIKKSPPRNVNMKCQLSSVGGSCPYPDPGQLDSTRRIVKIVKMPLNSKSKRDDMVSLPEPSITKRIVKFCSMMHPIGTTIGQKDDKDEGPTLDLRRSGVTTSSVTSHVNSGTLTIIDDTPLLSPKQPPCLTPLSIPVTQASPPRLISNESTKSISSPPKSTSMREVPPLIYCGQFKSSQVQMTSGGGGTVGGSGVGQTSPRTSPASNPSFFQRSPDTLWSLPSLHIRCKKPNLCSSPPGTVSSSSTRNLDTAHVNESTVDSGGDTSTADSRKRDAGWLYWNGKPLVKKSTMYDTHRQMPPSTISGYDNPSSSQSNTQLNLQLGAVSSSSSLLPAALENSRMTSSVMEEDWSDEPVNITTATVTSLKDDWDEPAKIITATATATSLEDDLDEPAKITTATATATSLEDDWDEPANIPTITATDSRTVDSESENNQSMSSKIRGQSDDDGIGPPSPVVTVSSGSDMDDDLRLKELKLMAMFYKVVVEEEEKEEKEEEEDEEEDEVGDRDEKPYESSSSDADLGRPALRSYSCTSYSFGSRPVNLEEEDGCSQQPRSPNVVSTVDKSSTPLLDSSQVQAPLALQEGLNCEATVPSSSTSTTGSMVTANTTVASDVIVPEIIHKLTPMAMAMPLPLITYTEQDRLNKKYVDLLLCLCNPVVDAHRDCIFGHRLILEQIPFVRQNLTPGLVQVDIIDIPGLKPAAVESVVRMFYTRELRLTDNFSFEDLFAVVEKFRIEDLINCFTLKANAIEVDNRVFLDALERYIIQNLSAYLEHPLISTHQHAQFAHYIEQALTIDLPQGILLNAIVEWAKVDLEGRKKHLYPFISKLNLGKIFDTSPLTLRKFFGPDSILASIPSCVQIHNEVLAGKAYELLNTNTNRNEEVKSEMKVEDGAGGIETATTMTLTQPVPVTTYAHASTTAGILRIKVEKELSKILTTGPGKGGGANRAELPLVTHPPPPPPQPTVVSCMSQGSTGVTTATDPSVGASEAKVQTGPKSVLDKSNCQVGASAITISPRSAGGKLNPVGFWCGTATSVLEGSKPEHPATPGSVKTGIMEVDTDVPAKKCPELVPTSSRTAEVKPQPKSLTSTSMSEHLTSSVSESSPPMNRQERSTQAEKDDHAETSSLRSMTSSTGGDMSMLGPTSNEVLLFLIPQKAGQHLVAYDFRNQTVHHLHALNHFYDFSCLAQVKNNMYDMGGAIGLHSSIWDSMQSTPRVDIFSREVTLPKKGPELLKKRRCFTVAVMDSCIYAIGGDLDDDDGTVRVSNCVEKLDTSTSRRPIWKKDSFLIRPRSCHASAILGGDLYTAGGIGQSIGWSYATDAQALASVEMYNVRDKAWVGVHPMKTGRRCFRLVTHDNKMYAIGGENKHGKPLRQVEVYDPEVDKWTNVAPMNQARSQYGIFQMDGNIYVIGGNTGEIRTMEYYNASTDKWTWVQGAWRKDFPAKANFYTSISISREYLFENLALNSRPLKGTHFLP